MRALPALVLLPGLLAADPSPAELRSRLARITPGTPSAQAAADTALHLIESAARTVRSSSRTRSRHKSANGKPGRPVTRVVVDRNRLAEAARLVAGLESGTDPFSGRSGDFRQAVRSPVDRSLQPYRLVVPPAIDRSARYPLVVALHGAHGDENTYLDAYADRVTGDRVFRKLGDERGYFLVAPRRYQGKFEADVLAIVDRLLAVYPIREDQVFLTGHSSGGVGTWMIGLRHPDRFAAMAAVGSAFRSLPGAIERLGAGSRVDKPMFYCHGERDRLATNSMARRMVDFLRSKMSYFVFRQFPDGHNTLGTSCMTAVFDFFDSVRSDTRILASDPVTGAPDPAPARTKRKRPATRRGPAGRPARG